jgi:hypothetical protein
MTIIKIHNITSDEIIEREMNDDELAQRESDKAVQLAEEQAAETKAAAKSVLFERLGISEAEAKLLLS